MKKPRWNQCREAKRQACFKSKDSCNSDAETCESHLCLKRTVFPADKLCGYVAKEDMEYEIDKVVYANGEQKMVREERFGHFANSQRLWFLKERYSCGNQPDDEKRHEVIADEKDQS